MKRKLISRRDFLKVATAGAGGAILVACGPAVSETLKAPTAPSTSVSPATATMAPMDMDAIVAQYKLDGRAKPEPLGWRMNLEAPPVKYDPPVKVTINCEYTGDVVFAEGETAEDNIIIRFHKDVMGIHYVPKWVTSSGEGADAKWATSMASGDLPDFMFLWVNSVALRQARAGDALEDITDIWESTASELTKRYKGFPDHPMWDHVRKGDRLIGIPFQDGIPYGSDNLFWIRQDWLDKVGMQVPESIDELEAVGRAFMDNGLGTMGIPLTMELMRGIGGGWMSTADPIFGGYGIMPGQFYEENGKLVSGTISPKNKEPLRLLAKWFADGFLAPDFVTWDSGATAEPISAGKAGMFYAPNWVVEWPIPDCVALDPEADWRAFRTPAGPAGRGKWGFNMSGSISAFVKGVNPKIVEAVIQHMNYRYAREERAYENKDYIENPFEGYSWVWEGDEVKAGPILQMKLIEPGGGGYPHYFGVQNSPNNRIITQILKRDPSTWNAMEKYLASSPLQVNLLKGLQLAEATSEDNIFDVYNGAPSETFLENLGAVNSLTQEVFLKMISGQTPVDDFDAFASDWLDKGGQELTDEANAWYESKK